jgi:hypothetical protein
LLGGLSNMFVVVVAVMFLVFRGEGLQHES